MNFTCVIPLDWIDLKSRSRNEAKSARIAAGFDGGGVKKLPGDVEKFDGVAATGGQQRHWWRIEQKIGR